MLHTLSYLLAQMHTVISLHSYNHSAAHCGSINYIPFSHNLNQFFLIVSSENVYNPRCYIYLCFTFDQSQGKMNLLSLRCYFNLYSAPPQEFYDITLENRSPLHNFIILILHLYLLVFCNNSPCTYTVDPSLPRNLMKN